MTTRLLLPPPSLIHLFLLSLVLNFYSDLEGLSKLLESSQKANEEASGGGGAAGGARALGPGDIGPSKSETAPASKTKAVTKDIWGVDDVKECDLFSTHVDPSDKRPEPAYKVLHP